METQICFSPTATDGTNPDFQEEKLNAPYFLDGRTSLFSDCFTLNYEKILTFTNQNHAMTHIDVSSYDVSSRDSILELRCCP